MRPALNFVLITAVIFSQLSAAAGVQAQQSWSLRGNAISPGDFLGTTNGESLIIQPRAGKVGIGTNDPRWSLDVKANHGIKLGLEGRGGGQLLLANNPNDNKIYMEAFNTNGDDSASELLLTGRNDENVPQISLHTDKTVFRSNNGRTNNDINISNAALQIDNPSGIQSMQYFSFGGVEKASIRADISGNLVFSGTSSRYYFGRDLGDPDSITFVPYNSGRTLTIDGNLKVGVLQITGGSDLAEPFAVNAQAAIQPGMVVAIDPAHPGQLRLADRAYDHTVAGIVSGANHIKPGMTMTSNADAEHTQPVALSGRVYVFADATHDAIQPGDLLTTADFPGHAMKVSDYARAQGAVLGKAMSALPAGRGLVLVLVSLQ